MTESSPPSSALTKTAPTPPASPPADISSGVFSGIAAFEAAQRMAQALCTSTMVPTEYRGQQGLSNSLIALEIAARMGLSPLVVMQNMTPIHGKPSWSSSFLIATVNASGRFTPLRFVFDDKENPNSCYAVARDKATGEVLEGQMISIEMARREGWWSRPDRYGKETSKWQSMTGQMLRYRAAAFWVKVYCPEISLGLMTQEEVADVQAVEVAAVDPISAGPSRPAPAIPLPLAQPLPAAGPEPAAAVATERDGLTQPSTAAENQDAPATRRGPRRSASAQKQAAQPAAESSASPQPTEPADGSAPPPSEQTLVVVEPAGSTSVGSAESAAIAAAQPSAAELVSTALQEIPKLASPEALERCRQRVNRLMAEGRLSDEGAERLWSVIDRRLQQLQANTAPTEAQQVS